MPPRWNCACSTATAGARPSGSRSLSAPTTCGTSISRTPRPGSSMAIACTAPTRRRPATDSIRTSCWSTLTASGWAGIFPGTMCISAIAPGTSRPTCRSTGATMRGSCGSRSLSTPRIPGRAKGGRRRRGKTRSSMRRMSKASRSSARTFRRRRGESCADCRSRERSRICGDSASARSSSCQYTPFSMRGISSTAA